MDKLCLAIPAQITEIISDETAIVDFGGVKREISTILVSDQNLQPGTWVYVHTGYTISVLDEKDARESLELWQEIFELEEKL